MYTVLMITENSKTNEPHKFIFNFSQKLNLTIFNECAALQ